MSRTTTNWDVNYATHGVEVETIVEQGYPSVGGYHHGECIPGTGTDFGEYMSQYDGSVDGNPDGFEKPVSCEIVSPVLQGILGVKTQLRIIENFVDEYEPAINYTCGIHVHVGYLQTLSEHEQIEFVRKLMFYVSNYENGIYGSTGKPQRKYACGRYATPIREEVSSHGFPDAITKRRLLQEVNDGLGNYRYLQYRNGLNVSHFIDSNPHKPTIEFRYFPSTLDRKQLALFHLLPLAICDKAARSKKMPRTKYIPHGEDKRDMSQYYYEETKRMLERLGWLPGSFATNPCGMKDVFETGYTYRQLANKALSNAREFDLECIIRGYGVGLQTGQD